MTVNAKQVLISGFEERIGDFLTVTQTRKTIRALREELNNFDVTSRSEAEISTDLLVIFLNAKQVSGKSKKTIHQYSYILERGIKDINIPIRRITTQNLRDYFAELSANKLSKTSIEGIRSIFSSFFTWLYTEELIVSNPMTNIEKVKQPKRIPKPFTDDEVQKLKDACKNEKELALVSFLLATGARVGEVTKLSRDDIDLDNCECIVNGKGDKERIVYFNEETAKILKNYLDHRTDDKKGLFPSKRQDYLTERGVQKLLDRLGERANVTKVYPHKFRTTLATNLSDNGMPVQEIQRILGHESIDTTMRYIFVSQRKVKESYSKYF